MHHYDPQIVLRTFILPQTFEGTRRPGQAPPVRRKESASNSQSSPAALSICTLSRANGSHQDSSINKLTLMGRCPGLYYVCLSGKLACHPISAVPISSSAMKSTSPISRRAALKSFGALGATLAAIHSTETPRGRSHRLCRLGSQPAPAMPERPFPSMFSRPHSLTRMSISSRKSSGSRALPPRACRATTGRCCSATTSTRTC